MNKKLLIAVLLTIGTNVAAQDSERVLQELDIFELEYATDPQISPDGSHVVYVRQSMDIMTDQAVQNLWIVDANGRNHRPLLSGVSSFSNPRWSPSGDRLLYVSRAGERGAELYVRWLDTGQTALLTNLPNSPGNIAWSPDGDSIAFDMFVDGEGLELATPPSTPDGAEWAAPVIVIDDLPYRADGAGYLDTGYSHVFVIPADGGTPRRLTDGDYNHNGPLSWSPDGTNIVFAANRVENPIDDPLEAELWSVDVASRDLTQLTDRNGPDFSPQYSSDGKRIAYLGFDDESLSYHNASVHLLDVATGISRKLTEDFDRSIGQLAWAGGSSRLFIAYDEHGVRKISRLSLSGAVDEIVDDVGSATHGRPYTSGAFSTSANGTLAYTRGSASRPADVGVVRSGSRARTLTNLNGDLFAKRTAASVEEINWQSSVGDYTIQGWLVKPPNFDADKKYPFILEIHGGPFAAYGPHFSPEIQLYAAAGYVVLYSNPRGSSSYGKEFANEIHHNYPSKDYDDLMAGVDAVIAKGFVDEDALFVTGGSGGGVLSSWIVGKTDRFRAAVVQKPVINWGSFVLTSDGSAFFTRYWFATPPWEDPEAYWARSPLSLVGNVKTPTMLMTGEQDFRTPISESEQFYQALKLRGIDTALVRVPERSHNLVGRPSHLIAKAANILAWFERYSE